MMTTTTTITGLSLGTGSIIGAAAGTAHQSGITTMAAASTTPAQPGQQAHSGISTPAMAERVSKGLGPMAGV
jgi:hypothetical protein